MLGEALAVPFLIEPQESRNAPLSIPHLCVQCMPCFLKKHKSKWLSLLESLSTFMVQFFPSEFSCESRCGVRVVVHGKSGRRCVIQITDLS